MKFGSLEIYKLVDRAWRLEGFYEDVDVIFNPEDDLVRRNSVGAAKWDHEIVAEILSDNDASIEITEDRIVIEGTLTKPEPADFTIVGKWELRP